MRVLLVEDDELLGDGLRTALLRTGHAVDWLKDGEHARQAVDGEGAEHWDVVLLDLGLPRRDGMEVLRTIRRRSAVPVLVMTARDQVDDRVQGLDAGADDYLVKPFDIAELEARLRAVSRRRAGRATDELRCGDLRLLPAAQEAFWRGERIDLTRREYMLLSTLVDNAGRVLTRDRLEQALYGWGDDVDSNALEVHIHHLRRKLAPDFIRTVRGVGYSVG
ncbi:MAG: response regulator [Pseudomonadota bacterium]